MPPPPANNPNLPAFGATLSGRVRFAGTDVPLPRGDWQVVAAMSGRTREGQASAYAMLAQAADRTLDGAMILYAVMPAAGVHAGFATDAICQSPNALFSRVFSAVDHGPQACWAVEAITLGDWNAPVTPPVVRSGVAELRQQGTALPPVVLRAYFAHADADHLLTVQLVAPVPAPPQPPFGWHTDEVRRTPDKLARAARLRDWAASWNLLVRRSFEGGPTPGIATPEFEALPR